MVVGSWPVDCIIQGVMKNRIIKTNQSAQFRTILLTERSRLAVGRPLGLEVLVLPGRAAVEDQAPLLHDQFVALRRYEIDRHKLKLIDAALERIIRQAFGTCEECGEAIPSRRIQAIPWAAYCVHCQERIGDRPTDSNANRQMQLAA